MSARPLLAVVVLLVAVGPAGCRHAAPATAAGPAPLRVCADPNNLPFTNRRGEGFENRLAELLARDLGTRLEYTWRAQRRGFLRETLNAGRCDVVLGLPAGLDAVRTTRPYYRSTYVFVSQRARHLDIRSVADPRLRALRIGVPLIGDDGANAPPAHLLARRGLVDRIVGYPVYGDYARESPPSAIVDAVAHGDVDLAAAWGPLAGYFAARQAVPLVCRPIVPAGGAADLPLAFDIAMATRKNDAPRQAALQAFLDRRRDDVDRLLAAYHVPRVDRPEEVPR